MSNKTFKLLLIALLFCTYAVMAQTVPPPAPAPPVLAAMDLVLPGNGLAQHDFLYCGEYDTRKQMQTIFRVQGGKVVWTYEIPINDHNNVLSEFDDIHQLSNGNVLFSTKTGWGEVTPDKQVVYNYECPKGTECHSAQPIGLDKVLFMQNGTPAKLMLMNIKTGKVEMEHEMNSKSPDDPKSVHGEFRHVRMTNKGTYLIAHMDLGKVIEYDKNWKEIWQCDAPSVWAAVRLKNGNTLISGNQNGFVREINSKGDIVWEIKNNDLPGIPLHSVQEVDRLANGNTLICNWTGNLKKADWPTIVQVIEVTPDKKVVWALREWNNPDLGTASCIQLLDQKGKEENGDFMR